MRILAFVLLVTSPFAAFASKPSNPRASVEAGSRTVRISLVNLSGKSRQVHLSSGNVDLPPGGRVDIDARIGTTLHIVSDIDRAIDEKIVVAAGDDRTLIPVR